MCTLSHFCATLWTAALKSPLSTGFSTPRTPEWVASMSSSGGSSRPRDRTVALASAARSGGFLATSTTWKPKGVKWERQKAREPGLGGHPAEEVAAEQHLGLRWRRPSRQSRALCLSFVREGTVQITSLEQLWGQQTAPGRRSHRNASLTAPPAC